MERHRERLTDRDCETTNRGMRLRDRENSPKMLKFTPVSVI